MCGAMGSVHVIVARVSICTRDGCRPLDSRLRGNDGVGTGMKTVGTGMMTEGTGMKTVGTETMTEGAGMKTVGTGMTRRDGRGGRRRLGGCAAGRTGEAGGADWADVEPEGRERRDAPIGRMCSRKDGRGGRRRLGGCAAGRTGEAGDDDWADVEPERTGGGFPIWRQRAVPFVSARCERSIWMGGGGWRED